MANVSSFSRQSLSTLWTNSRRSARSFSETAPSLSQMLLTKLFNFDALLSGIITIFCMEEPRSNYSQHSKRSTGQQKKGW